MDGLKAIGEPTNQNNTDCNHQRKENKQGRRKSKGKPKTHLTFFFSTSSCGIFIFIHNTHHSIHILLLINATDCSSLICILVLNKFMHPLIFAHLHTIHTSTITPQTYPLFACVVQAPLQTPHFVPLTTRAPVPQ